MTTQHPRYTVELVRRDHQQTTAWIGGTTTEIAICPRGADYSRRDFRWRISSAHVDAAESVFTKLPGIRRLIMVLEGSLALEHEHHHSVRLGPFQQDAFSGAWTTTSRGRARDFNVMLTQGCFGNLEAVNLQARSSWATLAKTEAVHGNAQREACLVYAADGTVVVHVGGDAPYRLMPGDALLVTADGSVFVPPMTVQNGCDHDIHIVMATMQYEEAAGILSMSIDGTEQGRC
jgi:uncharacterized protein